MRATSSTSLARSCGVTRAASTRGRSLPRLSTRRRRVAPHGKAQARRQAPTIAFRDANPSPCERPGGRRAEMRLATGRRGSTRLWCGGGGLNGTRAGRRTGDRCLPASDLARHRKLIPQPVRPTPRWKGRLASDGTPPQCASARVCACRVVWVWRDSLWSFGSRGEDSHHHPVCASRVCIPCLTPLPLGFCLFVRSFQQCQQQPEAPIGRGGQGRAVERFGARDPRLSAGLAPPAAVAGQCLVR